MIVKSIYKIPARHSLLSPAAWGSCGAASIYLGGKEIKGGAPADFVVKPHSVVEHLDVQLFSGHPKSL